MPDVLTEEMTTGGTTWVKLRARGAEWSHLTPEECAAIGSAWFHRYGTQRHGSQTFCVERHGDHVWLCVVDGKGGDPEKIALFADDGAMRKFIDVLNLAKMASHEHGRNGI
jgi:hypothetical protein